MLWNNIILVLGCFYYYLVPQEGVENFMIKLGGLLGIIWHLRSNVKDMELFLLNFI